MAIDRNNMIHDREGKYSGSAATRLSGADDLEHGGDDREGMIEPYASMSEEELDAARESLAELGVDMRPYAPGNPMYGNRDGRSGPASLHVRHGDTMDDRVAVTLSGPVDDTTLTVNPAYADLTAGFVDDYVKDAGQRGERVMDERPTPDDSGRKKPSAGDGSPHPVLGMTGYEESMHALADGRVTVDAHGLTGPDGRLIDAQALKDSPHARRLIKGVLDGSLLKGMKVADQRRVFRQAFNAASPYYRRKTMEKGGDMRRFIPTDFAVRSLRRRNPRQAVDILKSIHATDRNASAAIIRGGFPNDRHTAFLFINGTKTRDTESHTYTRGPRKGTTVTEYKGTAARRYLRLKFGNAAGSNGAPTDKELRRLRSTFAKMDGDPAAQGAAMYQLAYGSKDDSGRGLRRNGIAAEMLAYEGAMTRDGMAAFLELEKGRQPRGNSRLHPGQERLTAFRANLHAMAGAAGYEPRPSGPDAPSGETVREARAEELAYHRA